MMKWGRGLIGLIGCLGIVCCSEPTPEELASLTAQGYYKHLMRGEYDQFLDGKDLQGFQNDSSYRSQLLDCYRQYVRRQESDHRGILDVRVANAETDSSLACTNVFLVMCFGDSTNEEIVVPMVERQGTWRMR